MKAVSSMRVCLRLPTRLLFEGEASKLFAVAENGAFGLLPGHTDYVASLAPSVLVLTDPAGLELFFGIDYGLLVKHGRQVDIAVRRGMLGESLTTLSEAIESSFKEEDEHERAARTALSRLEVDIVRQLRQLQNPVI